MNRVSIGTALAFAILPFALPAAKPTPEDQLAVQEVFRTYVQAVNDCDVSALRASTTADFRARGIGMGTIYSARFQPNQEFCGSTSRGNYGFSAIARVVTSVTADVIIADAYFRTVLWPEGERAGVAYLTFVRRDGIWKLMNLKLHPTALEKPQLKVEAATHHDTPGPDGWVQLFDGGSTAAFIDITGSGFPKAWTVEDGLLRAVAGKQAFGLRTRDTYRSFELRFEWKTPLKGNSGVKYHIYFMFAGLGSDALGREYQIADDNGDPGAIQYAVERTGALYNQFAPKNASPKPVGEFNESAIIVKGRHCEHWLNGVKVLEYESESGPLEGPLVFQHHTTDMWFRNIKVRRLD